MQKISKSRLILYLSLTSIWFIINVALITHLTYLQDYSSIFRGLEAFLLRAFSVIVGGPLFASFIVNLLLKLRKYETPLTFTKKIAPSLLLIFPILTYVFISHQVISSIYYLNSSYVIWLLLLYTVHFVLLFRYSIAIIFNALDKCVEMEKVFSVIFIVSFILTTYIDTVPITHDYIIYKNKSAVWMQWESQTLEERRQQTYIDSYTYTVEYAENEILHSIQKQYEEKLIIIDVVPSWLSSDTLISYEATIGFEDKPYITFLVLRNYPEYDDVINQNYHVTENMLLNSELYDDKIQSFFDTNTFVQITNLNGDNNLSIRMAISVKDSNNIDEELESLFNMIQYFRLININIGVFNTELIISFHSDERSALRSIQFFEPGFLALRIDDSEEHEQFANIKSHEDLYAFLFEPHQY